MINKQTIIQQLTLLDLDSSQALLYLTLLEQGPQTPLTLSRLTSLNRSSIYRHLEKLSSLGLIKRTLAHKSITWTAEPPDHLELMLKSKFSSLETLQTTLPPLVKSLSSLAHSTHNPTQIHYYRGDEGLKQLLWNVTKAKHEQIGFGYLDWNHTVGKSFAEKLRQEYLRHQIKLRELVNPDSQISTLDFTANQAYLSLYSFREILPSLLKITHDSYIYNDCYAVLQKYQGEIFGIEIINQTIADSKRQIFEILWKLANPHDK